MVFHILFEFQYEFTVSTWFHGFVYNRCIIDVDMDIFEGFCSVYIQVYIWILLYMDTDSIN